MLFRKKSSKKPFWCFFPFNSPFSSHNGQANGHSRKLGTPCKKQGLHTLRVTKLHQLLMPLTVCCYLLLSVPAVMLGSKENRHFCLGPVSQLYHWLSYGAFFFFFLTSLIPWSKFPWADEKCNLWGSTILKTSILWRWPDNSFHTYRSTWSPVKFFIKMPWFVHDFPHKIKIL